MNGTDRPLQPAAPHSRVRPSESIVRAFLNAVPDPIFRISRDGVYLDYSAPQEAKLLASPEAFLGRHVSEILPPDHADQCLRAIARTLETGAIQTYEYRLEEGAGQTRFYEVRMASCAPDEVIAIVRNVTEPRRAQSALHKTEQRLSMHLKQTAFAVVEWGLNGDITQWNAGAERIFGYPAGAVLGQNGLELLVPPHGRAHVGRIWNELVHQRGGTHSTNENLTADGRVIICEWYNTPLVDETGGVIGIASLVQDITERVRSERELRQSRENYESIVNSVNGVVWEASPTNFEFTFVSQQARRILGYPVERWINEPDFWVQRIHPDDRDWVLQACRGAAAKGDERQFEYRMMRADGSVAWLRDSVTPIRENGAVKLRGIMVDITERKRAEASARESEARFRRVIDANLIGIYFWETSGRIIEANDVFLRMLGYTREDLEAGRINWRTSTPPELRYLSDRALEQMRHFGASRPYAKDLFRKDGSRVPVFIGDTFLEGSTDRGVGFVLDMTERRSFEERQALMIKELDHRVKNNMMAVLTLTEQSLRSPEPSVPPSRASVENLLGRLRALARTHNALAHTHWSGVHLGPLVQQTLEAFRHGDPLAVSIEGDDVLLPPKLATAMAMALHELATNALKYGSLSAPDGRVSVCWNRVVDASGAPAIRVVWQESGGPVVRPPARRGFGIELIEGGVSYEAQGRAQISFLPEGVRCEMMIGLRDAEAPAVEVVVKPPNQSAVGPR